MSSSNARTKAAREYARLHGVKYTEALRAVTDPTSTRPAERDPALMADQHTASAVHVTEILGAPGSGKTWNLFLNHVTHAKAEDPATVLLIFSDTGDVPRRFTPPGTGHMFRVAMDTIEAEALAALPPGAEATSLTEVVAVPGQDWLESMVSLPALEAGDALVLTGVGHRASTACTVFRAVATRMSEGTRFHLCLDDIASKVPFGEDSRTFDAGLEDALNSWRSLSRSHVYGFDVSRTAQELDATSECLKSWTTKTDPQATYEVVSGYQQGHQAGAVSAFMCGDSRYTRVLTTLRTGQFVRPLVGVVRVVVGAGNDDPIEVVVAAQEYLEQIGLVSQMVWAAADTVSRRGGRSGDEGWGGLLTR